VHITNAPASPPGTPLPANYTGDAEYVAASGTADFTVQGLLSLSRLHIAAKSSTRFNGRLHGKRLRDRNGEPAPTGSLSGASRDRKSELSGLSSHSRSGNSSTATCSVSNVLEVRTRLAPVVPGGQLLPFDERSGSEVVTDSAITDGDRAAKSSTRFNGRLHGKRLWDPERGTRPDGEPYVEPHGPEKSELSGLSSHSREWELEHGDVLGLERWRWGPTERWPAIRDSNYSTTNGTGSIAVSKATPTVNVVSSPTSPSPGSVSPSTATVCGSDWRAAPREPYVEPHGTRKSELSELRSRSRRWELEHGDVLGLERCGGNIAVSPAYAGDDNYFP